MASTAPSPVRIGIMATGSVTRHVLAVAKIIPSTFSIVAVSSRTVDQASAFAEANHIPNHFGSHEEMLRFEGVEAVYIALPNALHVEWVVKAIQHGKHVLCEKPISITTDGLALISDALRESSARLVVMEAWMALHTSQTTEVRNLLRSGVIGDIVACRGCFHSVRTRDSYRNGPLSQGGGSLWDVGCYPIALALRLLTDSDGQCPAVKHVNGFAVWHNSKQFNQEDRFDDLFAGTVVFQPSFQQNPVPLQFASSFVSPLQMAFELVGTKGCIVLANPYKPEVLDEVHVLSSDRTSHRFTKDSHPYQKEFEHFCQAVRGHLEESFTDVFFAKSIVTTIEALHKDVRSLRD